MESDLKFKRIWFIRSKKEKIEDVYKFDLKKDVSQLLRCVVNKNLDNLKLGEGTYGKVVKAFSTVGNHSRAIKIIPKEKVKNPEKFKLEIEIMRNLDHPNIIKLYETFEDPRNVYLVMELCNGGELFDRILKKGRFSESEARTLFTQIIRALYYCHANKICHRDLKPENFLMLDDSDTSPVKVIDFGLSKVFVDPEGNKVAMHSKAGTPYYIAPEVLKGTYDEQCDIWSAGVMLYILLCGYPPFTGDNDAQIIEAVKKAKVSFTGDEWKVVSSNAKDLINKILCPADKRIKAGEILEHPWMKEPGKTDDHPLPVKFGSLKYFRNAEKLKKAALTFIATQSNEEEIGEMSKIFQSLDKNGDGVLTLDELKAGLSGLNAKSARDLAAIFKSVDTDQNGTINYTEFLAATLEKSIYLKEEKLLETFKMFDKDGNGKISAEELKEVLGSEEPGKGIEYWIQMIKEVDINGDGEIDYYEFMKMMSNNKQ